MNTESVATYVDDMTPPDPRVSTTTLGSCRMTQACPTPTNRFSRQKLRSGSEMRASSRRTLTACLFLVQVYKTLHTTMSGRSHTLAGVSWCHAPVTVYLGLANIVTVHPRSKAQDLCPRDGHLSAHLLPSTKAPPHPHAVTTACGPGVSFPTQNTYPSTTVPTI